jgi:myosin heavy subunit
MENYLQTMDKLYGEIESRDGIIKQLKNDIQVIQNKYQNEINELKNKNTMSDLNNLKGDEKLLSELKTSKENEIKLNQQLSEIQKNYNEVKESNEKMKELAKETNNMIKTAIDSRDNLKKEYESAIKELIEKYEKQIKFMKTVLVKQSEEFEEKLKNKKDKEGEQNEDKNDKNEKKDEKMEEMMKIINDNKELLKQNEELKNINEVILSKMKELPNLEQKYTDLFDTVKLLQEENNLLKEASKYSSMIELSQSKIKEIPSDTNINNTNTNIFEDTPKTKSQINKKDNNNIIDQNNKPKSKNLLLDDDSEEDNKEELNKEKEEEIPNIKKKEIVFDKNNANNNLNNSESLNNNNDSNSQKRVYRKKKLPRQSSPKSSENNADSNHNKSNSNIQNESGEQKEENDENDENNKELINPNFNLYKPIKEGLLTFNLAKKNYYTIVPEKYEEFWESFDPETSIQYNTFEGLFIINSKQNNQLYYYSGKKNVFTTLFQFTEDHSYGCLFLDNLSKNIIAIGGKNSKAVEKFSFEDGTMKQLPPLSTHRSKMTCCQVGEKIYCFLGLCEERPNESIIEFLDLNNLNEGWTEVKYSNQSTFKVLTGMSCVNLNDSELFIIGGLINDEIPNEKLLYFNTEQNELFELNKELPDSEDKNYLFTKNTMFNVFLNGKIISYTNIDDNNQVHILDNELKYDLYLTPKA